MKVAVETADMGELDGLHQGDSPTYLAATETALLKFKLLELLGDLDKVLYLDGDILVRDNLIWLYETDLEDHYVAAVKDLPQVLYERQRIGGEIGGRDYFNSGVMLLNLEKMRRDGCTSALIEIKRNQADQSLMDQNAFNTLFQGKVKQLSFLYNACYINLWESRAVPHP